jgi:hypothetical protein
VDGGNCGRHGTCQRHRTAAAAAICPLVTARMCLEQEATSRYHRQAAARFVQDRRGHSGG